MTSSDVSVRFSDCRIQFAEGLLAEVQWWMLRATDSLDNTGTGTTDRDRLMAAALYVQWLRDEVSRLLEAAETQRANIRRLAKDSPADPPWSAPAGVRQVLVALPNVNDAPGWVMTPAPLPNGGLQRVHTEFYPVPWLLQKVWGLLRWSHGGTLGRQTHAIADGVACLRDWCGHVSLAEAVSASLGQAVSVDDVRALARDGDAADPTVGWLRWVSSAVSQYRVPPVSAAAHARYLSELLTSAKNRLQTAAALCAEDDAERTRLQVAAEYARWLRDGAIRDEMQAAAACAAPWSSTVREVSPWRAQWLSARPPVPTEALDRDDHHGLMALREVADEIAWLRNRSHGFEPVDGDPAYFTAWVSTIGSRNRW